MEKGSLSLCAGAAGGKKMAGTGPGHDEFVGERKGYFHSIFFTS